MLKREMENYGIIKTVVIPKDKKGKSVGYAFVEFDKEDDMVVAYKKADGKKIEGRRIVVDVERGRTAKDWRPMRFGGGLGGRKAKQSKKEIQKELERKQAEDAKRFKEGLSA